MAKAEYTIDVAYTRLERRVSFAPFAELVKSAGGRLCLLGFVPGAGHFAIAIGIDSGTLALLGSLVLPDLGSPN